MSLSDTLRSEVKAIFKAQWQKRTGRLVPEPEDLALGNEAVEFDRASILYADLSGSTALVQGQSWTEAAEIYKAYLLCAAKLIRDAGGAITSYDGDRVMGIFIGNSQSTTAVRCAKNPLCPQQYCSTRIAQPVSLHWLLNQAQGRDRHEPNKGCPHRGSRWQRLVWVGRPQTTQPSLQKSNRLLRPGSLQTSSTNSPTHSPG